MNKEILMTHEVLRFLEKSEIEGNLSRFNCVFIGKSAAPIILQALCSGELPGRTLANGEFLVCGVTLKFNIHTDENFAVEHAPIRDFLTYVNLDPRGMTT